MMSLYKFVRGHIWVARCLCRLLKPEKAHFGGEGQPVIGSEIPVSQEGTLHVFNPEYLHTGTVILGVVCHLKPQKAFQKNRNVSRQKLTAKQSATV